MQRKSMAVKDKNENSPAGIDWNVEAEVHLFSAMNGHKPVGVNKHFHMACIFEKFCTAINKNISPQVIWKHLQTMYDMQALDDSEVLPFPNDEKDFSLPDTLDFANMMHEKGKLCETKEDVSKAKEVKEASRKESKESPRKDDKKESPKKELKESPPKKELKESKDPSKKDSKDIAIVKKDVKETPKKESKEKESGKKEIRDSKEVSTGSRGGVSTSSRREVKDTGKDTNKREHRDSVSKKDAKERESRRDSKGESKSRESRDLSTKRDTRDSLRKDSTGSQKDNDSRKEIVVKKESKDSKDMKKDTKDMKRETRKDFKDARDLKSASVVSSKTKGRDSKKEEEKEEFSIRRSQPLAEDKRGSKRSTRGSIVNDGGSKCASPVTVLSSASSRSGTPQPTAKRRRL